MKKYSLLLGFLLHFFLPSPAQTVADLAKAKVFIQSIQDTKSNTKAHLMVMCYPDDSVSALKHSLWFLANEKTDNQLLGGSNLGGDFPIGVYDVKISPNGQYISVLQVGEGHPWIDIIDAQLLISRREYKVLSTLNPYPGGVEPIKWVGNLLLIASDMPMTKLNTAQSFENQEPSEKYNKFTFDPKLKKYAVYK
jgi:hypothetical protein